MFHLKQFSLKQFFLLLSVLIISSVLSASKANILLFNGWLWHLPGGGSNHFLYFHKNYPLFNNEYHFELLSAQGTFVATEAQKLGLSCHTFSPFPLQEQTAFSLCRNNNINIVTFPYWVDAQMLKRVAQKTPLKLVLVQQGMVAQELKNNIEQLRGIDAIVGHNQEIVDYFVWANNTYNLGIKRIENIAPCWDEERIDSTIYHLNGTSRKEFYKKRFDIKLSHHWPVICTIANMEDPVKNQKLLLQAIAKLHNHGTPVYAMLAGEGSLKPSLEKQAKDLGISKYVFFLGSVLDSPSLLFHSDMHVLPSYAEGFPVVNIEAAYMGKPIIAAQNTGGAFLIEHNTNGLLFINNDASSLASNIKYLIDNPQAREIMGERAARHVRNNYINKHLFQKWNKFFDSIK
jgi:glycosyltransferase involved in cell wall biosynthesis